MIFSRFKYKMFRSVVLRNIKSNRRKSIFPSFVDLKKVLLLVKETDLELHQPEINRLKQICAVDILLYSDEKRLKGEESIKICVNDLNWIGIPKNHFIKDFINNPYDILINLNDGSVAAFEYLSGASVARFKVGSKENGQIYDLVIGLPEKQKNGLIDGVLETIKRLKRN